VGNTENRNTSTIGLHRHIPYERKDEEDHRLARHIPRKREEEETQQIRNYNRRDPKVEHTRYPPQPLTSGPSGPSGLQLNANAPISITPVNSNLVLYQEPNDPYVNSYLEWERLQDVKNHLNALQYVQQPHYYYQHQTSVPHEQQQVLSNSVIPVSVPGLVHSYAPLYTSYSEHETLNSQFRNDIRYVANPILQWCPPQNQNY
jgi:hypothetical protein